MFLLLLMKKDRESRLELKDEGLKMAGSYYEAGYSVRHAKG